MDRHDTVSSPRSPLIDRLALAMWALALVVLVPLGLRWNARAGLAPAGAATESSDVDRRLHDAFTSPFATSAVLVIGGLTPPGDTDRWRAMIRDITAPIAAQSVVSAVISPGTSLDTLLVSRDFSTALALVGVRDAVPGALDSLRAVTAALLPRWRASHPGLTVEWTGAPVLLADLPASGAAATRRAEVRALPLTAVAAWWAFGSLAAALVATVVAVVTIAATFGLLGLLTPWLPPALSARMLVPLVGLALGFDYSLYLMRRRALPPAERIGTVWVAAVVVMAAFAALAIVPAGDLRAAAPGGMIVVAVAATAAISLVRTSTGTDAADLTGRWRRWGSHVVRHPLIAIVGGAAPLVALAALALHARLETPLRNWLPPQLESARALARLEQAGRANAAGTLHVLLHFPRPVLDSAGWEGLRRAGAGFGAVRGVGAVRSLATIGTGALVVARHVLPAAVTASYVSDDGFTALIELVPSFTDGDSLGALVRRVRAVDPSRLTALAGTSMLVGGLPAYVEDYAASVRHALPHVVTATTIATLLVLLLALRAPFLAVKAVLLNLLVAAAAVGVTVLVFQRGLGAAFLGGHAFGAVFPTVPVLAFGAAFGMSMDYELFLLAAFRDARRRADDDRVAIAAAVGASGPIIVRAAVLMAVVFAAFISAGLLPLEMIGTTLAAAVLLDATLVRLLLAPAILALAGRWNWWPGGPPARIG